MGRAGGGGALLDLLLGVQVVGVATLLAAVDSLGMQAGLTLAANRLVADVLLGELAEGRLDDVTHRQST